MKRNHIIVALIFLIFFVISLLTNILGPIIPEFIASFKLSNSMAGFLPFAFFFAYIVSIPAGVLAEKFSAKTLMVWAFGLATAGAFWFAFIPTYSTALPSLFTIGIGMAVLQVVINPLLRSAGGEEHFAFNSVFAQLIFGLASFLSPQLYSYLVTELQKNPLPDNSLIQTLSGIVPANQPWVSIYWVFCLIAILMVGVILISKLPRIELQEDEKAEKASVYSMLLRKRVVILFIIGIFVYVGTEQGIANWMSRFLEQYHGFNPQTDGADAVSSFWGLLTLGCLLGLVLLKFIDSRKVLILFTSFALISLSYGLFGPAHYSIIAFPACGFFLSVMWSVIFSLALNSLKNHHGAFSGLLCTAIIGGAIVPWVIGGLSDLIGLRFSMMVLYLTLGYILSIGFWAKPIVNNKTINLKTQKD
ncbi:MAG TPA: MFS transporter [Bacteroidales bacterium]|nr:MFS transporter [Bacteroidales bacterium]